MIGRWSRCSPDTGCQGLNEGPRVGGLLAASLFWLEVGVAHTMCGSFEKRPSAPTGCNTQAKVLLFAVTLGIRANRALWRTHSWRTACRRILARAAPGSREQAAATSKICPVPARWRIARIDFAPGCRWPAGQLAGTRIESTGRPGADADQRSRSRRATLRAASSPDANAPPVGHTREVGRTRLGASKLPMVASGQAGTTSWFGDHEIVVLGARCRGRRGH